MAKRPNVVDASVGQRLREARNRLGMTQESLADGVGLTFQQIQKYEKGANRISASRLQQFANILKVEVAWFFEGASPTKVAAKTFESADPLKRFADLPEAHQLMKAFVRIRDKELRRHIARLAGRLADLE